MAPSSHGVSNVRGKSQNFRTPELIARGAENIWRMAKNYVKTAVKDRLSLK
jgi:hypothetical protein